MIKSINYYKINATKKNDYSFASERKQTVTVDVNTGGRVRYNLINFLILVVGHNDCGHLTWEHDVIEITAYIL